MTLIEFLLARLAEDESVAQAATPGPWEWECAQTAGDEWGHQGHRPGDLVSQTARVISSWGYDADRVVVDNGADATHIARWDSARVLAEVEAKRRIVANHEPYPKVNGCCLEHSGFEPFEYMDCNVCCEASQYADSGGYCLTLRAVALPYADHADYQKEWRP